MMYNTPGNVSSHPHHPHHHHHPTTTSNTTPPRNLTTIPYPFLHHHNHQSIMIPLPPPPTSSPFPGGGGGVGGGGVDDDELPRRDERYPQWSNQETREFIEIRAQLEWEFLTSKRNKNLWETVADRMRDKGYRRTIDQCKGKWKNLVNRYKGLDAADVDHGRLCPFFDELHAMFSAKTNRMQPLHPDADIGLTKGKKKLRNVSEDKSHEELLEGPEDEEETELDHIGNREDASKKKTGRGKRQKTAKPEKDQMEPLAIINDNNGVLAAHQEMLRDFIQQQHRIDLQWKETMEKCAQEREMFEQEWRQMMEKLERERLIMEQAWREKEEQRRVREESRAEKRDALLTALLNKLIRDENH